MKTYYTTKPLSIDYKEYHNGTIVFFRENISEGQYDPVMDVEKYSADEYTVVLHCSAAVARKRVEDNLDMWFEAAKEASTPSVPLPDPSAMLLELAADHEERICLLELGV